MATTEHHAQNKCPAFVIAQKKRWTYTWLGTGEDELYDLKTDPYQLENVAAKYPEIRAEMSTLVAGYLASATVALPGMDILP